MREDFSEEFVYVAQGEFEIVDECFVEMYTKLMSDNAALENDYLKLTKNEKTYFFRIDTDEKDTFTSVISHIAEYGTILMLDGYAYDGYNERRSELYKLINHRVVVLEDNLKQEYQEDADYHLFRGILQTSSGGNFSAKLDQELNITNEELHQKLIEAANLSETDDAFKEGLKVILGENNISPLLSLKVSDLWVAEEENEKYTIEIFVKDNEIKFFVNYESGKFEESSKGFEWYQIEPTDEYEESYNIKVKLLDSMEPYHVTVGRAAAFDLFHSQFETKVLNNDTWVDACSVCENRLAREINGCMYCEFKVV